MTNERGYVVDPNTGWEINKDLLADHPELTRPLPLKVPKHLQAVKTWEQGKAAGMPDAYLDSLVGAGMISPRNEWLVDISHIPIEEKYFTALRITEVYLGDEFKGQFRQLFSHENVAITAGVMGLWAASHWAGIGFVVDAILLAVGALLTGQQVSDAAADLFDFMAIAGRARNLRDLHRAAKHMARFISTVGIDVFMSLVTRGRGRRRRIDDLGVPLLDGRLTGRRIGRQMIHDVGKKTGLSSPEIFRLQIIASKYRVEIYVRPPRLGHGKLRVLGHPRKPEWAKMKTNRELDPLIGGPAEDGVAFFKPDLPDAHLKVSNPALHKRAMKQYKKRKAEWDSVELHAEINSRADRIFISPDGRLIDRETGLSFVSDVDFFEIRDVQTGRRLTPNDPTYHKVMRELEAAPIRAQHGPHVNWWVTNLKDARLKSMIIREHETKQPLIRFQSDCSVWLTFAEKPPKVPLGLSFGRGEDRF